MVVALVAALCLPLVLFAALDTRPPDDHDAYYTNPLVADLLAWQHAEGPLPGVRALVRHAFDGGNAQLPPLVRVGWLAVLGWLGPGTFSFRIAALPFLVLTLLGSYLAGRQLLGHRAGLLAAFVVGTLPAVLNYSRKADLMTHGMALTALALFVALRIVRSPERRGRGVWIVLGVIQGLRLYTHPIVLGDVVLIYGGLLLVLAVEAWGAWGMLWRSRLGGLGLSVGCTLVVGAWYLVPDMSFYEGPTYSLYHYWAGRAHFLNAGGAGGYEPYLLSEVTVRLASDLGRIHLHPVVLGLVVVPGLLSVPLVLRPGSVGAEEAATRRGLLLVAIVLLGQLPLVVVTLRNYAYTVDWVGLSLPTVLLCLGSLGVARRTYAPRAAWLGPVFAVVLVVNGLATASIPLVRSLAGPDPVAHPGRVQGGIELLFGRCETGRATTHHFVTRTPNSGVALADRMAAVAGAGAPTREPAVLAIWDLRRDLTAAEQAGCDPWAPPDRDCCHWHLTQVPVVQQREPWPHVFAGFGGLLVMEQPAADAARFHVVRLYHGWEIPPSRWDADPHGHHALVDDACLAGALALVEARLGSPLSSSSIVDDPTHWFMFRDVEERSPYLERSVVVDRGGGPISAPIVAGP